MIVRFYALWIDKVLVAFKYFLPPPILTLYRLAVLSPRAGLSLNSADWLIGGGGGGGGGGGECGQLAR